MQPINLTQQPGLTTFCQYVSELVKFTFLDTIFHFIICAIWHAPIKYHENQNLRHITSNESTKK